MRWRRITLAHFAATVLLASGLGACGSSDSSVPGVADAAASDTAAPDRDSAAVSRDAGIAQGADASAASDVAQGGPADAASPPDAGSSGGDASSAVDGDADIVGTGADSARPESGAADAGSDAANALACNALVNGAPTVQLTVSAGVPPASIGGPLVSGTYFLTAATAYGGNPLCTAISLKETALITSTTTMAGMLDLVASVSLAATQQTTHDDYTRSGPILSLQPTCPPVDGGVTQLQYTATTAGEVDLTLPSMSIPGCGTVVEVFIKQ